MNYMNYIVMALGLFAGQFLMNSFGRNGSYYKGFCIGILTVFFYALFCFIIGYFKGK